MSYTSLVYFHILLSLSCVAASVANLVAICDLSIVVAFGHNELWRPKAAESVCVTSQLLWPSATTNCGSWRPRQVASKLAVISPHGNTGSLAIAVFSRPSFRRPRQLPLLLLTHSGPAHGGEPTIQTLPVWDHDKETMGTKIYDTLIPYGILIIFIFGYGNKYFFLWRNRGW